MWDTMSYGDMINEQEVRILLECILVFKIVHADLHSILLQVNHHVHHKAVLEERNMATRQGIIMTAGTMKSDRA